MYRLSIKQLSVFPVLLLFVSTNMLAQVTAPTPASFNFSHIEVSHRNSCKVFIGVGTSTVSEGRSSKGRKNLINFSFSFSF